MSIASTLSALADTLSTILSQINTKLTQKGVSGTAATLAEVPAKINAIVTGEGIDTSDATATAGDIISGKTAYVNGEKVTGSIAEKSSSDVTVSGATVTVPAGSYPSNIQKSVPSVLAATPSISVDTSTGVITATNTQSAGYVAAATKTKTEQMNVDAGGIFTPGTAAIVIPGGRFLTGNISIPGSSALIPSNIRKGVSIFGVSGTAAAMEIVPSIYDVDSKGYFTGQTKLTLTTPSGLGGNMCGVIIVMKREAQVSMNGQIDTVVATVDGGSGVPGIVLVDADKKNAVSYGSSVCTVSGSQLTVDVSGIQLNGNGAYFSTESGLYGFIPIIG